MHASTGIPTESRYPIPASSPEKDRLSKQYAMRKMVYGLSNAVPDVVDLTQVESVIDVGAGTCAWMLDLVANPQVHSRLNEMRLYVCDIDTGFFPPSINELGIMALQQDVTKSFPNELHGTFDLVHASFLVGCLTRVGWSSALNNYHRLLKPGGLLMLDEIDTIFLPDNLEQVPRQLDPVNYDLSQHMAGHGWIHAANCIYTGFVLQKGFIVRITSELTGILEKHGFRVEDSKLGVMPFGVSCRSRGASLAEYEEASMTNVELVLGHLAAQMLEGGTLEFPKGNIIDGDVEMNRILKDIGDGIRREGAVTLVGYFVATNLEG